MNLSCKCYGCSRIIDRESDREWRTYGKRQIDGQNKGWVGNQNERKRQKYRQKKANK